MSERCVPVRPRLTCKAHCDPSGARVQHAGREHRGQRRAEGGAARLPAAGGARARVAPRRAARPARALARPALLPRLRAGH